MDKKLKFLKILFLITLVLLTVRAGYLQIVRGDYYYQLSEGNRISIRPINAPKGRILANSSNDEKEVLVSNKLSYNLYLLPNEIPQKLTVEDMIKKVADLIELEEAYYQNPGETETEESGNTSYSVDTAVSDNEDFNILWDNYQNQKDETRRSFPVLLKRNISPENMLIVEENIDELSGIIVEESSIRNYVYQNFASHLLMGLEREYGDEYREYLIGEDGLEQIEINSLGEKVRTLGVKSPKPGYDLYTSINFELQSRIEELLKEKAQKLQQELEEDEEQHHNSVISGSVIVMNTNTGQILSMASYPDYDLAQLAQGISQREYQRLSSNSGMPFFDRSTMATEPPGSVFKLITGAAAIDTLGVEANTQFYDENAQYRGFNNWHNRGEGEISFSRALARSNNIIFYKLGDRLHNKYRGDKLIEYAEKFGLGKKTGIDLADEKSGQVPSPERIKYFGDSINLSIGQGFLQVTPLQVTQLVSAIANKGTIYRPYIVDKIIDTSNEDIIKDINPEIKNEIDINENVFDILLQGMVQVTHSSYGTASNVFHDFPVKIAGKTGTAQTSGLNHGWFVGFAPAEDPEIAVTVFLENGQTSQNALPIAKEIFKNYFKLGDEELNVNISEYDNNYFEPDYNLFNFYDNTFSTRG